MRSLVVSDHVSMSLRRYLPPEIMSARLRQNIAFHQQVTSKTISPLLSILTKAYSTTNTCNNKQNKTRK